METYLNECQRLINIKLGWFACLSFGSVLCYRVKSQPAVQPVSGISSAKIKLTLVYDAGQRKKFIRRRISEFSNLK